IEDIIGLERLGCLHLNDSLQPFASHRDRHARIGQGELGDDFFARLLAEPRLHGIPKILEVPGGNDAYRKDLRRLARLARRA
ncbi:MAG: TIM barrel protein, partial [Alphaproteobacteria bacterium]